VTNDAQVPASGGTFSGDVTHNGDVTVSGDKELVKSSSGNFTSWRVISKTSLAQNVEFDTGVSSSVALGFLAITEADSTNPDTVFFKFSAGTMTIIQDINGFVVNSSSPASTRHGLYSGASSTICVKTGYGAGADLTISIMTSD
jgi:hypothetical protein